VAVAVVVGVMVGVRVTVAVIVGVFVIVAVGDGEMVVVAVAVGRGVLVEVASGVLVGGIGVLVEVNTGPLVFVAVAVIVCAYALPDHKADANATSVLIQSTRIAVRSGLRQHSTLPAYALRYVRPVKRTKSATSSSLRHEAPSNKTFTNVWFLASIESGLPNDSFRGSTPLRNILKFPLTPLLIATNPTSPIRTVGA
jgi:hypothetical protein